MKNKFSIGEMATLHGISITTLRYYHKIGLFKPAEIHESSNYRYYSIDQFEKLNMINYLKYLGISLHEINSILDKRNIDYLVNILKKESEEIDKKIEKLKKSKRNIKYRYDELIWAQECKEIDKPYISLKDERYILKLDSLVKNKGDLELGLRKLNSSSNEPMVFTGRVGLIISKEKLENRKFDSFDSIYISIDESDDYAKEVTIKKGMYGTIYYSGGHKENKEYLLKLINYIVNNGYKIIGDAFERSIIDEFIEKKENRILTVIEIPIEKS